MLWIVLLRFWRVRGRLGFASEVSLGFGHDDVVLGFQERFSKHMIPESL
jgi:hypothetical protein